MTFEVEPWVRRFDAADQPLERWRVDAGDQVEALVASCEDTLRDREGDIVEGIRGGDRLVLHESEEGPLADRDPAEPSFAGGERHLPVRTWGEGPHHPLPVLAGAR